MVQIITNSKLLRGGPTAAGNFYGVVDLFGFENQKCNLAGEMFGFCAEVLVKMKKIYDIACIWCKWCKQD